MTAAKAASNRLTYLPTDEIHFVLQAVQDVLGFAVAERRKRQGNLPLGFAGTHALCTQGRVVTIARQQRSLPLLVVVQNRPSPESS